jgi:hypothetical protein
MKMVYEAKYVNLITFFYIMREREREREFEFTWGFVYVLPVKAVFMNIEIILA